MTKQLYFISLLLLILCTSSACQSSIDCNNDIACMITNNHPIKVEACDLSGYRRANVKVDIGYDSKQITRNYYGYTNNYRQLIYVQADNLILQTPSEEHHGHRLCDGQANVKGTELRNYDKGHVIADALGGVSNAYNITAQNSYLNRKGLQSELEHYLIDKLQNHHQVTNVEVIISYPNSTTLIPDNYVFSWELDGVRQKVSFENK